MPKGEKRKGGRPKGSKSGHTLEAEQYRKVLIEKILKYKEPLAQALVDKGLAGDIGALREIHDRSLGRVKEIVEIQETSLQIDV